MTTERSTVTKLAADGSNWVTYRDRMIITFRGRQWSDHFTNTTTSTAYTTAGVINGRDPDQRWSIDEDMAIDLISNTVPDQVFNRVKAKTTVMEMWNAIKAIHQARSQIATIDLGLKMQGTKLADEGDALAHIKCLQDMREQLAALGKTVDDDEFSSILMGSLPRSYRSVVLALSAAADQAGQRVIPDRVIRLVTDEYESRNREKGQNGQNEAFTASTQKQRDRRNTKCYNCHKKGHYKSDCWAKGGDKEGQRPPRRNNNDSSTDNCGNRNRNNRGSNSNSCSNRNEDANTANAPDIEAWAAIEELEENEPNIPAVYATELPTHQSEVEVELYDSGASRHMSPFRHCFTNYQTIPPRAITAANKRTFYAIGTGDLKVDVPNGNMSTPVLLRNTLHAPEMALTIVSIGRITSTGNSVTFGNNTCEIKNKSGKTIGSIPASSNGLFKVEHSHFAANAHAVEQVDMHTLHRRLGHISANAIRSLIRNHAIDGVQLVDDGSQIICDSCEYAKLTRKPIRSERVAPPAKHFGAEVHTNLWGPSPISSLGGRRYYISFTDDHTRFTHVDILRTKDQALEAYKAFAAWAQTQHGAKIKLLRSDRGGEYTGQDFTKFLQAEGTERRLTTHDTPQHNGVAESLNRRLLERARAILHHSGLPKNLWAEAIRFAVWLKNRASTRALGNDITPFEKLYGDKPNLSSVPEWGQSIWVHTGTGSKLDARGVEARWIGFDSESTHAHRVYWPYKQTVTVERNVKFVIPTAMVYTRPPRVIAPAQLPAAPTTAPAQPPAPPAPQVPSLPPAHPPSPVQAPQALPPLLPPPSPLTPLSRASSTVSTPQMPGGMQPEPPEPPRQQPSKGKAPQEPRRVSSRIPRPSATVRAIQRGEGTSGEEYEFPPGPNESRLYHPDWPGHRTTGSMAIDDNLDYAYLAGCDELLEAAVAESHDDPKSLAQARSRVDWPKWQEAMDREIATLEEAGTWATVPRPTGKNIVSSKWVFRIKRKADGTIEKYKACLVARGFTQKLGVDYFETFSPVAKLASFRIILAMAARNDWDADTFDFNGAYLNGELDDNEEIYMQAPPSYDSEGEQVKRLLKSLYGLKQAGRKWYDTLCRALNDLGFVANDADPGVFFAHDGEHVTILAIHVDDCLITGSSTNLISSYKEKLNSHYSLTDLGPVHWLLGLKITHNREARTISLSQTLYINAILSRFSLDNAKPVATPIVPGASLSKADGPSDDTELMQMKKIPYREAVGSLMYAAVATRPDITFAVSALSQFLENPGEVHWQAVKRVFRYLAGTKTHALTYGNEHHDLIGFTNADGASQEHRHAISGFAFLIDGAAISWASRKQELVTLSTAEAEYVAATHAAKECIWLRRLIKPLFGPTTTPTPLLCDNQAALRLATDDNYHARTKHIDIRFHFI